MNRRTVLDTLHRLGGRATIRRLGFETEAPGPQLLGAVRQLYRRGTVTTSAAHGADLTPSVVVVATSNPVRHDTDDWTTPASGTPNVEKVLRGRSRAGNGEPVGSVVCDARRGVALRNVGEAVSR